MIFFFKNAGSQLCFRFFSRFLLLLFFFLSYFPRPTHMLTGRVPVGHGVDFGVNDSGKGAGFCFFPATIRPVYHNQPSTVPWAAAVVFVGEESSLHYVSLLPEYTNVYTVRSSLLLRYTQALILYVCHVCLYTHKR